MSYLDGVATGAREYLGDVANDRVPDDDAELAATGFVIWFTCPSRYHVVSINLDLAC